MMRWSLLIPVIFLCLIGVPNEAGAQGAATGGTRDMGTAPTVIFPRDEPSRPTAVPNVSRGQQRVIRFRHAYPIRSYRWGTRRGY
jgi:hypothetical protein